MKINEISSCKPSFGHISKMAVDAVRGHAEGYRVNNRTGETYYSANQKYDLMDINELKRLENLVKRASVLDNSWIDFNHVNGLYVDFYKDCNPWHAYHFDIQKDGNAGSALDTLERAVNVAESGESADIDENKKSNPVWEAEIKAVNHAPERFRSINDNLMLKRIYDKTFDVRA